MQRITKGETFLSMVSSGLWLKETSATCLPFSMHFECFSLSGLAWANYRLHPRGMLPLYISHLIDLDEISLKILFLFLLFFPLMQPALIPQQSSFRSLCSPLVCLYSEISFLSHNAEEIISWCFSISEYWHRCCWKWCALFLLLPVHTWAHTLVI